MSKSNHQKYLSKLNDEYELIRPIDNPITKCDILRFKRYEYTTPSIEKIGNTPFRKWSNMRKKPMLNF